MPDRSGDEPSDAETSAVDSSHDDRPGDEPSGGDEDGGRLPDLGPGRPSPTDLDRPAPTRRRLLALAGLGAAGAGTWDVVRGARDVDVAAPENRPDVADGAVADYVRRSTDFGVDLLSELVAADPDRNVMVSPVGLSGALAMAWAGARGDTERGMAEALHFPDGQDRLHPAIGALQYDLDQRGQGVQHRPVPEVWNVNRFELGLANAFWGQEDTPFRESFRETLARDYGSPLREVDFKTDPAGARQRIDQWAATVSDGRVDQLLPPAAINTLTRAVVANVVALRADWKRPFDPDDTEPGTFTRPDGSTVEVPMMHQESEFPFVDGRTDGGGSEDGTGGGVAYRVVELPYVSRDLSMVLAVPLRDHSLADLEAVVDAAWLQSRFDDLDGLTGTFDVNVTMPRFTFGNDLELRDRLEALGMTTAFDRRRANFEGVTDPPEAADDFFLRQVVHDTHVAVDEEGTVAVAVSGVALQSRVSASPAIRLDRPFLFCIRDRKTDAVLFLGRVVDPSKE